MGNTGKLGELPLLPFFVPVKFHAFTKKMNSNLSLWGHCSGNQVGYDTRPALNEKENTNINTSIFDFPLFLTIYSTVLYTVHTYAMYNAGYAYAVLLSPHITYRPVSTVLTAKVFFTKDTNYLYEMGLTVEPRLNISRRHLEIQQ